ncbi:hypothetical protein E3_0550 [Rhodococcus phage E3]|uniref:hypothetical protein n=1 Tax=Rhodococcus phage E3 TaxID=1007869 RepID=UPI0002C6D982|nr:hypothetical protein M176_gp059 [Rhodococcus phage E3]AEQ20969.1 hypothetical protein E3_0550 [Rhodococcus phage E3]
MTTVLKRTQPTARKEHRCETCFSKIQPGVQYHRATVLYDGRIYEWVNCGPCEDVFDAVWGWSNQYDEGIGPDDYEEWACEFESDPACGEQARAYLARRWPDRA